MLVTKFIDPLRKYKVERYSLCQLNPNSCGLYGRFVTKRGICQCFCIVRAETVAEDSQVILTIRYQRGLLLETAWGLKEALTGRIRFTTGASWDTAPRGFLKCLKGCDISQLELTTPRMWQ